MVPICTLNESQGSSASVACCNGLGSVPSAGSHFQGIVLFLIVPLGIYTLVPVELEEVNPQFNYCGYFVRTSRNRLEVKGKAKLVIYRHGGEGKMARSTRWGRSAEILVITVLFHSKMARAVSNGGDDKDEFANNLFSDLAPLLALFGERVAQQFLSEAVSNWSDSIIFAMAPIGILTAVIGAIRAGAPNWVKALVGRSRESSAVVELELLSSTSTDVCEMWNGGAIVRIMGSPPILQLIGIEGATEEKDKFLTLDCEGFKREATRELFKHHTAIDDGETGADSGGTTQYQLIAGQSPKHVGPNISLNLNLHKNRKTLELRAFACVGILIQLAVPAYTALITYHPKHEKLKKGEHVAKYAYPLTIIGMGLVSFGMIICATVIGRKTREYTWTWWEESKRKNLRILWIQKQATVNDQVFDSYAIISPNACNFVMTSWPSNLHLNQQRKTTGLSQVAPSQRLGNHSHNLRQRNPIPTITPAIGLQRRASSIEPQKVQHSGAVYGFLHGRWPETVWTLIGAFAGLAGFIVQFVGMRAMQADAAIAQLIATGVMVAVRAVIRRQPKMRPLAVRLDPDFELDWLAEASYQGASKIWEYNQNDCEKPSKVEIGHCCGYGETPSGSLVHSLQPWDDRFVQTNDVQHLLHGRVYLRQLSLWPSKGVRTATALARAIEVVMDTLFPLDSGGDFAKYRWPINVTRDGTANGTDTEEIYFTIERKGKAKTWAASLPEIEAALSLRLYALHKRSHTSIRHTNYLDAIEKEGRASVEQSINLLCPNTQSARRDFEWWLPGGSAILEASLEPCTTKSPDSMSFNMNKYSNIEVKPERILGYRLNQRNFGRDLYTFATTRFEPDKFHDPTNKQDEHRAPWLASLTYAPIENAIAQDWFSAFLWSAASATTCHKIDHCNTRTRPKDIREVETRPHWSAFCLEDSSITTMAESFHESGLGTLRDGYMRVIASLSYHDKLPDAESELFRLSREHAKKLLLEQEFKEAGKLYLWLFRTSMTFGRRSSQATRGTALLLECFRYLSVISEMRMYELQEGAMVKNVREVLKDLHHELKSAADRETMLELIRLGHIQGRLEEVDELRKYKWGIDELAEDRVDDFHDTLRISHLHAIVIGKRIEEIKEARGRGVDEVDVYGWSPLHYAAANGTSEMINSLLRRAANTRIADLAGWTPLHYAAMRGNFPTVQALLYGGADPLLCGVDGLTPLHCAAQSGSVDVTFQLLQVGSIMDSRDNYGRTPLHWAAYRGHKPVVNLLLQWNASTDTTDKNGKSSIHFAAMNDDEPLLEALMKRMTKRSQKDRNQSSPVHTASAFGNASAVACLVYKGFQPRDKDKNQSTPLHLAAEMGHLEVVKVFPKRASDAVRILDGGQCTPLHLAIRSGAQQIVEAIVHWELKELKKQEPELFPMGITSLELEQIKVVEKAKIRTRAKEFLRSRIISPDNVRHKASLHDAVALDDLGMVQTLLSRRDEFKIDEELKDRSTPLHVAVRSSNTKMVEYLLSKGANINAATIEKMTPLAVAVSMGDLAMSKLLMKDADLLVKTRKGDSLLHLAVAFCPEFTNILLEPSLRFDINTRNNLRNTALHTAVILGNQDMANLLISFNADIEASNADYATPLYLATAYSKLPIQEQLEMVNLLLRHGADVAFMGGTEEHPQTALHYASRYNKPELVEALLAADNGRAISLATRPPASLTPLHMAATDGNEDCAQLLINAGAPIDVKTTEILRTPLHLAARYGKIEVAKLLVEKGADVFCKDRDGDDALANAMYGTYGNGKRDNLHVITYLKKVIQKRREAGDLRGVKMMRHA